MPDFESMGIAQIEEYMRDCSARIVQAKADKKDANRLLLVARHRAARTQVEAVLAASTPTLDMLDANEASALHAHSRGRSGALPDTRLQKQVEEAFMKLGYDVRVDGGGRTTVRRTQGLGTERGSAA